MATYPYNYDTFEREMTKEDAHFHSGPKPGDLAPDFDLPLIGSGRIRSTDFKEKKAVLLNFGSIT